MASNQKRLLTAPNSKLAKADLVTVLRKDDSWILLPQDIREQLYSLLPAPQDGEAPHDPDVHPLKTMYKPYIEEELRRFKDDLKDGREQKKWREEAMQAGKDRAAGKFDEWKEAEREENWGKSEAENVDVNVNGETGHHDEQTEAVGEKLEVKDSEGEA